MSEISSLNQLPCFEIWLMSPKSVFNIVRVYQLRTYSYIGHMRLYENCFNKNDCISNLEDGTYALIHFRRSTHESYFNRHLIKSLHKNENIKNFSISRDNAYRDT